MYLQTEVGRVGPHSFIGNTSFKRASSFHYRLKLVFFIDKFLPTSRNGFTRNLSISILSLQSKFKADIVIAGGQGSLN